MQRKSGTILLPLVGLLLWAVGACGPASRQPRERESRKFDGVTLRVACPDALGKQIVQRFAPGWAHRVGAKVEIVQETAGADVWVLPAAELPHHAAADTLAPLPESLLTDRSVDWRGLLPLYREHLLLWGRTPYALPLRGDCPLCFYRKDWFQNATYRTEFRLLYGRDLQPPATWDDYLRIAEFFHEQGKRQSPSLPPLPADDRSLDALFYTIAASTARRAVREDEPERVRPSEEDLFAFHFDLKTGAPRVAKPGFALALRLLKATQAYRPERTSPEPWQAFRDGKAALCLEDGRRLEEFQKSPPPPRGVRDCVGVCAVPGSAVYYTFVEGQKQSLAGDRVNRVPYLGAGALLLAVPRPSPLPSPPGGEGRVRGGQTDAAFALVAELGGQFVSQQVVLEPSWGGGLVRLAHLDREHWDAFRLDAEASRQLRSALRQTFEPVLLNPLGCLRLPKERLFAQELLKQLRPALAAKEVPGTALAEVSAAWEKRIGEHKEEHLRDYRLSLGLPAK